MYSVDNRKASLKDIKRAQKIVIDNLLGSIDYHSEAVKQFSIINRQKEMINQIILFNNEKYEFEKNIQLRDAFKVILKI